MCIRTYVFMYLYACMYVCKGVMCTCMYLIERYARVYTDTSVYMCVLVIADRSVTRTPLQLAGRSLMKGPGRESLG